MIKNSGCESCALHCGLAKVQEALPGIIAYAEGQQTLNHLGIEVVNQVFDGTCLDIQLEQEMEGLTGMRDNSVTAAAKASERYEVFGAVADSLHADAVRMNDHIQAISCGPVDLRTAEMIQENMEISCAGGPRRGLRIPLTNVVLPLWGGHGKEHCASSVRNVVAAFLQRMSATYPGILDDPRTSLEVPEA